MTTSASGGGALVLTLAVFAALASTACTGDITGASPGGGGVTSGGTLGAGGTGLGSAGAPVVPAPDAKVAEGTGTMPLRRLGVAEYANTIASLLGAEIATSVTFTADPQGTSTYPFPTLVGGVERDAFEQAADEIAGKVASQLATLAPCTAGGDERACAKQFVTSFGKRAFRRPVSDAETTQLLGLYDAVRAAPISLSYVQAAKTLLSAMLQSPQFLYHWELGPAKPVAEGGSLRLNGYEVASRLSYFMWGTMPDAALLAAADAGQLDTQAGVDTQVRRMLPLADTARLVTGMVGWWIRTDKLAGLQKQPSVANVTPELKTAMRDEFAAFTADTLLKRGSYVDFLTSPNSFVTASTASLYGLSGSFGTTPTATALPNGRAGLFSQAAFLAVEALPQESSPVRRGKLVATRLLCRTILPPPAGVDVTPPTVSDNVQTREAYAQHSQNATCAGCHKQMDPLGFAFEHFDAVGRYRDMEAGKPIDATGTILGLDGKDVGFDGATAMMQAIAGSEEGQRCFVQQMTGYALNRSLGDFDAATQDAAFTAFKSGSLDPRELVPAIASSKSFRYRVPAAGENIQ